MKKDVLNLVIQVLEDESKPFTMSSWARDINTGVSVHPTSEIMRCKTAACIAGSLFLTLSREERKKRAERSGTFLPHIIKNTAADMLDIDDHTASVLFEMGVYVGCRAVKREDALRMLYHLRDTGVLDWSKAFVKGHPLHGVTMPTPINITFT